MEAALAEMSIDDLMQDVEEDVDFISKGMFCLYDSHSLIHDLY